VPHRDMREFLAVLEQRGYLRRIGREVDRGWEIACLAKWMYQALPAEQRFGLQFHNVKGSSMPVVTGALGACPESVAIALMCEVEGINDRVVEGLRHRVAPRLVAAGVSQQVVRLGKDASLDILPVVTWTPVKDKAPYITTIVVTRDHDTGVRNMGVYRTMVRDAHSVVINLAPGRQGFRNVKTWTDRGKKAPIAWVIAAEPVVHLATIANLPYGRDEMEFAGGLKGGPIDLVRCKSHDIEVPAIAEIIIEGEIAPDDYDDEGPFGEFAGYMGAVDRRAVAHVTAITHRRDPLYYGYTSQMPPSESTTIQSQINSGVILRTLRDDLGFQNVRDVCVDMNFGGFLGAGVVAIDVQRPGDGKRVGRTVADVTDLKRVTVVDADVDIRDQSHVDWALNSRYAPQRDTIIIDDVFVPILMDPSVRDAHGNVSPGSKLVIDATQKIDPGAISLPPKEMMERALGVWAECGLPELKIPKRARLRIEKS
jgi:UbiD family decarboxylase